MLRKVSQPKHALCSHWNAPKFAFIARANTFDKTHWLCYWDFTINNPTLLFIDSFFFRFECRSNSKHSSVSWLIIFNIQTQVIITWNTTIGRWLDITFSHPIIPYWHEHNKQPMWCCINELVCHYKWQMIQPPNLFDISPFRYSISVYFDYTAAC